MRCDGLVEGVRAPGCQGGIHVPRRRQRGEVAIVLAESGRDRLHPDGAQSRRDIAAKKRASNGRLADPGIGAGDEYTVTHRVTRGSMRMIALPSSAIRGSGFQAWP